MDCTNTIHLSTDPQASVYVDASAGSGKTTLLVDRILRIMLTGSDPSKILCITFTNAAADEMYDRLRAKLLALLKGDENYLSSELSRIFGDKNNVEQISKLARSLFKKFINNKPQIQTLHSFCAGILNKMHIIELQDNLTAFDSKIIDEGEKQELIYQSFQKALINKSLHESVRKLLERYDPSYLLEILYEFSNQATDVANIADIKSCLGVNEIQSKKDIINSYTDSLNFDTMCEVVDILLSDKTTTARSAANTIKSFLDNQDNFDEYANVFLTAEYRPRARLPINKQMRDKYQHIEQFLLDEQQKLYKVFQEINKCEAASLNTSFARVAKFILDDFTEQKKKRNLFEYSDLIKESSALLRDSNNTSNLLYGIDLSIEHIMIDEAQDLSKLQWSMIQTITDDFFSGIGTTPTQRTIFIVGDFKQAIFGFQGAEPKIFQDIKHFYREKVQSMGSKWYEIKLDTCYRCTPEILSLVDVIFNNPDIKDSFNLQDESVTHKSAKLPGFGKVEIHTIAATNGEIDSATATAEAIAYKIKGWLDSRFEIFTGPITPQDIMILFQRRSKLQDELIKILQGMKIPVSNLASRVSANEIYIYDIIAAIQFALQPFDDMNLVALLKSPPFNISENDLVAICTNRRETVWDALQNTQHSESLSQILTKGRKLDVQSFVQWYLETFYKGGLQFLDYVFEYYSQTNRFKISLSNFLAWLEEKLCEKKEMSFDNNSIRITTVHSAKGLEAPVVILADAGTACFNNNSTFIKKNGILLLKTKNLLSEEEYASCNNDAYKENMRLLYVAMTRAKYELHVFGSESENQNWFNIIRHNHK